jgi:hypothetical protein
VYQLLSQPFVIAVERSVYVLSDTGINLLTMSVIAVYKETEDGFFHLIVLTESADYLKLAIDQGEGGQALFERFEATANNQQFGTADVIKTLDFTANGALSDCLNNKLFICSQLWEITADEDCAETGWIDFSGEYSLVFETSCRGEPGDDGYDYCAGADGAPGWLAEHTEIKEGVTLTAKLTWRDDICDPKLFKIKFTADMFFFRDAGYTEPAGKKLYQVGEGIIYVKIITNYPDSAYSVFETQLLNVWICTFDPAITPGDPDVSGGTATGGCWRDDRDNTGFVRNIYNDPDTKEEGFVLDGDGGHPGTAPDFDQAELIFYFTVPYKVQRDTLYVQAQVEVSLSNGQRRRLVIAANGVANQMGLFVGHTGVSDKAAPEQPPQQPPQQPRQQPQYPHEPQAQPFYGAEPASFVISLSSPWIVAIGGLLAVILAFNIVFLCYMNCNKRRGRGSVNRRRRSGYSSVKGVDSEDFHDSEVNAINVASE